MPQKRFGIDVSRIWDVSSISSNHATVFICSNQALEKTLEIITRIHRESVYRKEEIERHSKYYFTTLYAIRTYLD